MPGPGVPLRLAFMGTPDFAVPALQSLATAGHDIAAVYAQPPRPAGRGQQPRPSPVQRLAQERGLMLRTPLSLKTPQALADWQALHLDAAVVAAYGLILPKAFLDAPRLGCFNIHASLLPRWRGAAPIHRAIMAGDAETGVGIMQMAPGLDTGPLLAERRVAIAPDMTTGRLHDLLAAMGAALVVETLAGVAAGTVTAQAQAPGGVTYAAKIDKAQAHIDWAQPAEDIDRLVRGLAPFPGAWFAVDGKRVKVLAGAVAAPPECRAGGAPGSIPGTVLCADPLTIACGAGAYRPLIVQREGKAAMPVAAFLRGSMLAAGAVLA